MCYIDHDDYTGNCANETVNRHGYVVPANWVVCNARMESEVQCRLPTLHISQGDFDNKNEEF